LPHNLWSIVPMPFHDGAQDSEVEDWEFPVEELDYGDAPDPTYPTLLANNGARHVYVGNIYMGALIDEEQDGQPDPNAMGDDLANQPDEDGRVVTIGTSKSLRACISTVSKRVTLSKPNAWCW
jgi:hypothetical protein